MVWNEIQLGDIKLMGHTVYTSLFWLHTNTRKKRESYAAARSSRHQNSPPKGERASDQENTPTHKWKAKHCRADLIQLTHKHTHAHTQKERPHKCAHVVCTVDTREEKENMNMLCVYRYACSFVSPHIMITLDVNATHAQSFAWRLSRSLKRRKIHMWPDMCVCVRYTRLCINRACNGLLPYHTEKCRKTSKQNFAKRKSVPLFPVHKKSFTKYAIDRYYKS